jgi:hypothetical protein
MSSNTQSLIALAITVLIVFRFARRELKARVVRARTLWIRPAIMVPLAAYLIVLSSQIDPAGDLEMVSAVAGGVILGLITAYLIVRNTRFTPAAEPNAIVAQGSTFTFAVWVVALAIRFAARFVLPYGDAPRTQLPLDCGTVMTAATAFVVIALAFYRRIRVAGSGALAARPL